MSGHQRCGVPGCVAFAADTGVCAPHRLEEVLATIFVGPCLPSPAPDPWDHALASLMEEQENCWTDEDLVRSAPIVVRPVDVRWQPAGGSPYGRAVLAAAVRRVAGAPPGMRNNTLNREACLVGGYVASGHIDPEYAARGLLEGARICEMDEREACQVIPRALRDGARRPIEPPAA